MPIPDYQTLMLPVLRLAQAETRVSDLLDPIAEAFGLTPDEREQLLPSGRQRLLANRVHWAKTYLAKAGLVSSTRRGWFVLSDAGRDLISRNPERVDNSVLYTFPSFREFVQGGRSEAAGNDLPSREIVTVPSQAHVPEATPEELIETAFVALQAALRSELLSRILQNSPDFFETVIVDLLVAMGYGGSRQNAATKLGRSGDGGVDGVINEDALGLDRVYVQAKRYAPTSGVGRPDVQAFVGSLVGLGASKGIFVTTSGFSAQALDYAKHLPQRVVLIDGRRLADLMIEHDVGVRRTRRLDFKRVDEDFFVDED